MERCPVCGAYLYDKRRHLVEHDEWLNGVRLRRPEAFETVGTVQGLPVFLVRPISRQFQMERAERVSRRSIREPLGKGGYDKPLFNSDPLMSPAALHSHALILSSTGRGVGILVMERRPIVGFYRWTKSRAKAVRQTKINRIPRWTVAHVWLLPSLRGRGIAADLVRLACEGVGLSPDRIGWLEPYTPRGFRLMEALTSRGFFCAVSGVPRLRTVDLPFPATLGSVPYSDGPRLPKERPPTQGSRVRHPAVLFAMMVAEERLIPAASVGLTQQDQLKEA